MGFMDSWEKWSQNQYEKWGKHLQSKYDKFRNKKTPEWYILMTDNVWGQLSDTLKEILNNMVTRLGKEYNATFAKRIVKACVDELEDQHRV